MYVSMYVYVPGGALRPKRCVIEAPNSPRAAFFSFATFFSCWCFRLPALDFSEPPPFLPPLLMARLPALLLGITSYVLTIKLAYGTGELVDMGVSDHQTVHQNARNLSARIAISSVERYLLIRKGQGRPPADYYVDVLLCAYQTNYASSKRANVIY